MRKPREMKFPYAFEKNGRVGKIYRLKRGTFKTHFRFGGEPFQNTFKTVEAALLYLEKEFKRLDTDRGNALSLNPLNSDVKTYSELEQLLREKGGGATLREAVTFFLANHKSKRFEPMVFKDCAEKYVSFQRGNNISSSQVKTLEKHYRRFSKDFGTRKIHEIEALEISEWLGRQTDVKTGERWSSKTRTSNLGSLVSLSLFAQGTLKAIPHFGKTEFQSIRKPKRDERPEVEIYTPQEMEMLLLEAIEKDIELIPALVSGGFQGLRPAEFHAEGTKRPPLKWEAYIWGDNVLHVTGQKVRSKANRDVPLQASTIAWLKPFRECKLTGAIWRHRQAYTKEMISLREGLAVNSIYDGLRHSYASYRIRHLKGNLPELAQEMGNSPREIIDSYKRNVSDKEADAWFTIMPPDGYDEKIKFLLGLG